MDPTPIASHCAELDRCNQRGGRMLSVFDLLDANTLDLDLAAFLMTRISKGDSFLVGARPGGAGKTTVMCALLNFVPVGLGIVAATSAAVRNGAAARRCFICHEIGSGPYFAYLWDRDLRNYCALSEKGHMLATNLHADDLDEAKDQICVDNGVPESHFHAFRLAIFLRVRGGYRDARHWIEAVYASDGQGPHRLVYDAAKGLREDERHMEPEHACRQFLEQNHRAGIRTIQQTREQVVDFLIRRANPQGA